MSYSNPLHHRPDDKQYSSYSSLNGATVNSHASSQFNSAFRRRLPQLPYTPSSKWHRATGRTNTVHPAISFDFKGYKRQGVPMRELSAHNIGQKIEDPEYTVLAHTGLQRITFRIQWPGYTHIEWARSIEVASNGLITRAQLARKIAQNFSRFIEMINRGQTSSSPHDQIGPTGIKFEHLVLVGLHNVFEDSWQADVAVDLR